jgi:serine O-acetyltransferase
MPEPIFRAPLSATDQRVIRLVYRQKRSWWRQRLLETIGVEIPPEVTIGSGLRLRHVMAGGVVVHPRTRLGNNVTIYQRVTVGRADIWREHGPDWFGFVIEDEAILCAGAVITSPGTRSEPLVVAEGSVVAANSVLTTSTGPWEIWAGAPAKRIGEREKPHS